MFAAVPGLAAAADPAQATVLLDGNPLAGYQGATAVETATPGQRVDVEVYGRDITGVNGFSAQIAFDATKLAFDGFTDGGAIPGFTGLQIAPSSGTVEVGGASVDGAASVANGRLGVVHFKVLDGFSGSATVSIQSATISTGTTSQTSSAQSQVVVGGTPATPVVLDADMTAGYQGAKGVLDVKAGDVVTLEIYGHDLTGVSGFSAKLQYDASKLTFDSYTDAGLIPDFTGLKILPQSGVVEIGGASVDGVSHVASGRLGVVTFKVRSGLAAATDISLVDGQVALNGSSSAFQSSLVISVSPMAGASGVKTPDFDGSGKVDFQDFLLFAAGFGKAEGNPAFNPLLDLDNSGAVDFPDFLLFAQSFGK
jgi:hypothetical protein